MRKIIACGGGSGNGLFVADTCCKAGLRFCISLRPGASGTIMPSLKSQLRCIHSMTAKKTSKKAPKKAAKKTKKKVAHSKKVQKKGIEPLGDRVLVKLVTTVAEERSPSGIILPSSKDEKPERGKVIAVGEGRVNEAGNIVPMRVSVGDFIIFSKYGFDEVTVGDADYVIVAESSILAIINE